MSTTIQEQELKAAEELVQQIRDHWHFLLSLFDDCPEHLKDDLVRRISRTNERLLEQKSVIDKLKNEK